ncbi:MAG: hypothetical protein ACREVL_01725 [Solimonas sp.]
MTTSHAIIIAAAILAAGYAFTQRYTTVRASDTSAFRTDHWSGRIDVCDVKPDQSGGYAIACY